jgi:hypothetical protein
MRQKTGKRPKTEKRPTSKTMTRTERAMTAGRMHMKATMT